MTMTNEIEELRERAEAAEAQVAAMREALEAFAKHFGPLEDNEMLHPEARRCFALARAALASAAPVERADPDHPSWFELVEEPKP